MSAFTFDLDAYLRRVGLAAPPSPPDLAALATVMAAQSRAIAFENIDVVLGRAISIEPADVARKYRHEDGHIPSSCFTGAMPRCSRRTSQSICTCDCH